MTQQGNVSIILQWHVFDHVSLYLSLTMQQLAAVLRLALVGHHILLDKQALVEPEEQTVKIVWRPEVVIKITLSVPS